MREAGLGVGLERFDLLVAGQPYGQIDIVDQQTATLELAALPEFPLEIPAERARQLAEAWGQRANMESLPYEVRQEQREV